MKKRNHLTEKEEMIMELLWSRKEPLTSVEMFRHFGTLGWNENNIYRSLNSLLEKELIRVCGQQLHHSLYARTFEPIYSKEEYVVHFLWQIKKGFIARIMTALVQEDMEGTKSNDEVIAQLEAIVKELKEKQESPWQ